MQVGTAVGRIFHVPLHAEAELVRFKRRSGGILTLQAMVDVEVVPDCVPVSISRVTKIPVPEYGADGGPKQGG